MGAIVNTIVVIIAGILGLLLKKGINEKNEIGVIRALGVAIMFIGISGVVSKMLVFNNGSFTLCGSMNLTISMSLGTLIGECFEIETKFESLGKVIKEKIKLEDSKFVVAFVNTSLSICIGAMAIIGAMEDGLVHNPSTLYTKSVIDFVIVTIFSATMGVGAIFSAIPILVIEGGITLLSSACASFFTPQVIDAISMVGSVLIFCVGVNLVKPYQFKVANMLPALVVIVILTFIL